MVKIIPIASGKGGVGKSLIALNLSTVLADRGRAVILADFDLGGASQHLLLGMSIKGCDTGIGSLIYGKETKLENLIQSTLYKRLHFIAGDQMMIGTSHLNINLKKKIAKEMREVVSDYLIVDLGAGSNYTIVDLFLSSYNGIMVVTPEITSIMSAYIFLKAVVFRFMYRFYKAGSGERKLIKDFLANRLEGSSLSYKNLIDRLSKENASKTKELLAEIAKLKPILVINMSRESKDIAWVEKLKDIAFKKLNLEFSALVALPMDIDVKESVINRKPLAMSSKNNSFVVQLQKLADIIENYNMEILLKSSPNLYNDDEEI